MSLKSSSILFRHSEIQILKRCASSPPSAPLDLGGCPTSGPPSTDSSDLPSTVYVK